MKQFLRFFIIALAIFGGVNHFIINANPAIAISDSDVDKILKAKEIVRNMVNYPDTLVFHEFSTRVNGNTVTLKFTCENGFGVKETHTKDIRVD